MLRALLLLALVLVPASQGRVDGGTPVAFVAVERPAQLVAVDLTSRHVIGRIPVASTPHDVAAGAGLRYVLVTSPFAGRVTLVDSFTRRVVAVYTGLGSPQQVEFAPYPGHVAYVTDERRGELVVLSLTRQRVLRRVGVGAGAHGLAVSPDGTRVWVTHGPSARTATIVDTSTPSRARVVGRAAARGAREIAFAPNGLFVWVTYWNSSLVGEIRAYPRTGRLRLQQVVGALGAIEVGDPGELWATEPATGRTFRLSRWSGRPIRTLAGCAGAQDVALGGPLAVACRDSGALAVYDRSTWRRTLVAVGRAPDGVAVAVTP